MGFAPAHRVTPILQIALIPTICNYSEGPGSCGISANLLE